MENNSDQLSITEINNEYYNSLENAVTDQSIIQIETTQTPEIIRDPKSWPRSKKLSILFIVSLAGMIGPISSTIFYPIISVVEKELNTSEVLTNGLVGSFVFFMGLAPLGWASYSDTFETRRNIYLTSFIIYIMGSIVCALSRNIWLLLVMRSVQACGASAVMSVGAGTISDIFYPLERGRAYGVYYIGPLFGPVMGPVIGGYLAEYLGWNWIFWFLSIVGGVVVILIFFLLPETFAREPQLLIPKTTTPLLPSQKRFDPIEPLLLLRNPNMSLITIYISLTSAIVFAQNTLVSRTFSTRYHLSTSGIGTIFLAPSAGYMAGSILGGRWSDIALAKAKKRNGGVAYPEMRINSVWIGVILFSASYICYGWFLEANTHMVFPIFTMFISGFSFMIVFNSISTYLVDAFPGKSASAIAVNNFCRSLAAAIFIFASAPFEDTFGTGWTYTVMICFTMIGVFCLIAVYYKGKSWRKNV